MYLIVSALQLKLGVPSFRKGSLPLTHNYNLVSKWAFQVYLQLPFLFELRTLTDWAFTKTALDFWQWLKFEDLYARLYITKVNQSYYIDRTIGEPIDKCYKFWIGICGTLVTILIILAPMLIFSSLNFIVFDNPVRTMSAEFGILVNANYFRMFSVSRIQDMHDLTEKEWEAKKFNLLRDIKDTEKGDIQVLTIPISGDTIWDITPESRDVLMTSLGSNNTIEVMMTTTYTRDVRLM